MQVEVRLFATLREGRFKTRRFEVPSPCRIRDLLKHAGIPARKVHLRLVNGESSGLDRELADQDVVSLFPAVGGG